MTILESLLNGGNIIKVAHELYTTENDKLMRENERAKAEADYLQAVNTAQAATNTAEAASPSVFVAGWRPAIGWVGAIALAYQFVVYPLLQWLPVTAPTPPDSGMLYTLITGMLGIAGLRSYDKAKGTDTRGVK